MCGDFVATCMCLCEAGQAVIGGKNEMKCRASGNASSNPPFVPADPAVRPHVVEPRHVGHVQ
eukprot:365392-Chlamydomonas_euryale.AAC.7